MGCVQRRDEKLGVDRYTPDPDLACGRDPIRDRSRPGNRRWLADAAALRIHANSLDYRLRMIERALGYSVRSGDTAFMLQLALKLLPLTAAYSSSSGRLVTT